MVILVKEERDQITIFTKKSQILKSNRQWNKVDKIKVENMLSKISQYRKDILEIIMVILSISFRGKNV